MTESNAVLEIGAPAPDPDHDIDLRSGKFDRTSTVQLHTAFGKFTATGSRRHDGTHLLS